MAGAFAGHVPPLALLDGVGRIAREFDKTTIDPDKLASHSFTIR
jgi:hypothetical protein